MARPQTQSAPGRAPAGPAVPPRSEALVAEVRALRDRADRARAECAALIHDIERVRAAASGARLRSLETLGGDVHG